MCGIAVNIGGTVEEVHRMGQVIKSRGTRHRSFSLRDLNVWFSHLPITDISAQDQPFSCGKWLVWMNGFISNYQELAHAFKIQMESNCDTEFLVRFIDKFGVDQERLLVLNGFFSVFVYDIERKNHYAFTDRYGIKQLYRYHDASRNVTYYASEVKSILAVCPLEISEEGAEDWLYSLGVMNQHTIYEGVTRVDGLPFRYPRPLQVSYEEAKDRLSYLLSISLDRNKSKAHADGVFLSGGVDSGILAKRLNPDYCFSMDYRDESFSEIENIKRNSNGIHHTMICNEKLFQVYRDPAVEVLDDLKAGSCYTNYALTELAGEFCTILYSGAGGDEVFKGYAHRYARPIQDVIKRTLVTDDFLPYIHYDEISHDQYDWKFLKAILVVEDRMAGRFTMETRYPLLDNDFVDFALSLPEVYRINKRILKDISGLPKEVVEGKKRGFSNPYCTNFEWAKYALNHKRKYEHQLLR